MVSETDTKYLLDLVDELRDRILALEKTKGVSFLGWPKWE